MPGLVKRRLFEEKKDDKEVEKIFGSPERDARNKELSNGHKYYFAINLVRPAARPSQPTARPTTN